MVCTRDLMEPWRTRLAGWASASAEEREQLRRDFAEELELGKDDPSWSNVVIRAPTPLEAENHHEWLRTQLGNVVSRVCVPDLMEDPGVLILVLEECITGALVFEHEFRVPRPVTPSGDDDDDAYWAAKCGKECTSAVLAYWPVPAALQN